MNVHGVSPECRDVAWRVQRHGVVDDAHWVKRFPLPFSRSNHCTPRAPVVWQVANQEAVVELLEVLALSGQCLLTDAVPNMELLGELGGPTTWCVCGLTLLGWPSSLAALPCCSRSWFYRDVLCIYLLLSPWWCVREFTDVCPRTRWSRWLEFVVATAHASSGRGQGVGQIDREDSRRGWTVLSAGRGVCTRGKPRVVSGEDACTQYALRSMPVSPSARTRHTVAQCQWGDVDFFCILFIFMGPARGDVCEPQRGLPVGG